MQTASIIIGSGLALMACATFLPIIPRRARPAATIVMFGLLIFGVEVVLGTWPMGNP